MVPIIYNLSDTLIDLGHITFYTLLFFEIFQGLKKLQISNAEITLVHILRRNYNGRKYMANQNQIIPKSFNFSIKNYYSIHNLCWFETKTKTG